jgi:hypothetical protein
MEFSSEEHLWTNFIMVFDQRRSMSVTVTPSTAHSGQTDRAIDWVIHLFRLVGDKDVILTVAVSDESHAIVTRILST